MCECGGVNKILKCFVCCVDCYFQAASGAVQCQMMDMTYPGVVPMHKVGNYLVFAWPFLVCFVNDYCVDMLVVLCNAVVILG